MNLMIKDLIKEASIGCDDELTGDSIDRFAVLIADRCISIIEASQPPETTPWDCCDAIRKKFGIAA